MVGHLTPRSARVWTQWLPAQSVGKIMAISAEVSLWIEWHRPGSGGSKRRTSVQRVSETNDWTAHFSLDHLEPGTAYEYRVHWRLGSQVGSSDPAIVRTPALWAWRSDPPALRVLAGSCVYTNDPADDRPGRSFGGGESIFSTMTALMPDVTLWMGDNVYLREADFGDLVASSRRYARWRELPELQGLLRTGSHLAVWDDHDYGPNDSNRSWVHKGDSLGLFRRYWANPSYGLPDLPGVFTQAQQSDVGFFLLDDRWNRDSDALLGTDKAMFGAEQLAWLRNALLASTATWKVIVSGNQLFNDHNRYEGWNRFANEREAFVAWLTQQGIRGVLFLSGDRHFSAAFERPREGAYPLREFTCSPMTAGAFANPGAELVGNTNLVPGSPVLVRNFCQLDFSGPKDDRQLKVQIIDAQGQSRWAAQYREAQFR